MSLFKVKSIRRVWLVGHRGAMGYAPENTIASFQLARKMGADIVECDVHISRDKKCIVMHDESVERTTNGYGLIRDLNSKKIKSLDAGSWHSKKYKNEPVPTLKELLLWARETTSLQGLPIGVVIEIKNEPVRYFEIEKRVIETVLKTEMQERVALISFDHGVVKRAKKINSKIFTGMLYNRAIDNSILRAKQIGADAIFPRRNFITKTLVKTAHKNNILIFTWTVNEVPEMKKLIRTNVDGIATNFPDRLYCLLR